jgi:hypothetical protein
MEEILARSALVPLRLRHPGSIESTAWCGLKRRNSNLSWSFSPLAPQTVDFPNWFFSEKWHFSLKEPDRRARSRVTTAERASQYRAALAGDPALTRAELARRCGVSRAWVSRVLG